MSNGVLVTENLREILIQLSQEGILLSSLVKTLSDSEDELLDTLLRKSGMASKLMITLDSKHKKSMESLQDKYQILFGEIQSGNNSPIIKKN